MDMELKSLLQEYHAIPDADEKYRILFHPTTLRLFRLPDDVVRQIGSESHESLQSEDARAEIHRILAQGVEETGGDSDGGHPRPGYLAKLQLILGNSCNLRCRYCYAGDGSYGLPKSEMTPAVVEQALCTVVSRYNEIGTLNFFGGEPTLSLDALEHACRVVTRLVEEGSLTHMPVFTIVTNMVVKDIQRFAQIVKRFSIGVTASVDGPRGIHDSLRRTATGLGSWELVDACTHHLMSATGQPRQIETTWTGVHKREGYETKEVMRFLRDRFGVRAFILSPVSSEDPQLRLFERTDIPAALEFQRRRLQDGWGLLTSDGILDYVALQPLLALIRGKRSDTLCGAGLSELTVAPNGDLYPCHLFLGRAETNMGSLLCSKGQVWSSSVFMHATQGFLDARKSQMEPCRECWARGLCRRCLASAYLAEGSISRPQEDQCYLTRETVAESIRLLAGAYADKAIWGRAVSSLLESLDTQS